MSVKVTFGAVKEVYNNIGVASFISKKKNDRNHFKNYIKLVKENELINHLFMIHYNIENRVEPDRERAREYVKANINSLSKFGANAIKESLIKLVTPVILEHKLMDYAGSEREKLHDNISILMLGENTPKYIDAIVTARENVVDYIVNNKSKTREKSFIPNSILAATLVNKFNEEYKDLDKSEKDILNKLLESDNGGKEALLNEVITECGELIEIHLKNASGETKEKLIATKEKLSECVYSEDGFFKDLSKMVGLRKSLLV